MPRASASPRSPRPRRDGRDLAERVIAELQLFGDELAGQDAFIARVGELVDTIRRRGVDAAIADAVSASQTHSSTHQREEMQPMKALAIHGKEDIRWEDRESRRPATARSACG